MLHVLGQKYGKERVGLYRDNGLAWFENKSAPQAEKIRKDVIEIFKQVFDFNTKETNAIIAISLGITLKFSRGP